MSKKIYKAFIKCSDYKDQSDCWKDKKDDLFQLFSKLDLTGSFTDKSNNIECVIAGEKGNIEKVLHKLNNDMGFEIEECREVKL